LINKENYKNIVKVIYPDLHNPDKSEMLNTLIVNNYLIIFKDIWEIPVYINPFELINELKKIYSGNDRIIKIVLKDKKEVILNLNEFLEIVKNYFFESNYKFQKNEKIFIGILYNNQKNRGRLELKVIDYKLNPKFNVHILRKIKTFPIISNGKFKFKKGRAFIIGNLKDNIATPDAKYTIFIKVNYYKHF